MEQPNGPSEPDEVVNISYVPMEDNKTLKDAYSTKAATIFGIFQIIIGLLLLGLYNNACIKMAGLPGTCPQTSDRHQSFQRVWKSCQVGRLSVERRTA